MTIAVGKLHIYEGADLCCKSSRENMAFGCGSWEPPIISFSEWFMVLEVWSNTADRYPGVKLLRQDGSVVYAYAGVDLLRPVT